MGAVLSVGGLEATSPLWASLVVVPSADTAWPAALVVVGREVVPFGACTAPTWAVSASVGPGRLDAAPSVPQHSSRLRPST